MQTENLKQTIADLDNVENCAYCKKLLPILKTDGSGRPVCFKCAGLTHPPRRVEKVQGRNEKCVCGSGKKFKNCCLPVGQN